MPDDPSKPNIPSTVSPDGVSQANHWNSTDRESATSRLLKLMPEGKLSYDQILLELGVLEKEATSAT